MTKKKSGSVKKLGGLAMKLCQLFKLFTDKPMVGVNIKIPLKIGPKGEIVEASTTLDNLINHFGMMNEYMVFMEDVISCERVHSIPSWLSTSAKDFMKRKFQQECLNILRKRLDDSTILKWYFYCISPCQFIKDEITGNLELVTEAVRPLVPLPVSPNWCEEKGFSQGDIENFGYQVGWLCWNLTRGRFLQKKEDVLKMFGPWLYYLAVEEPVFFSTLEEKIKINLSLSREHKILDSKKLDSLKTVRELRRLEVAKKKKVLMATNKT